jgi:hypothetical protein
MLPSGAPIYCPACRQWKWNAVLLGYWLDFEPIEICSGCWRLVDVTDVDVNLLHRRKLPGCNEQPKGVCGPCAQSLLRPFLHDKRIRSVGSQECRMVGEGHAPRRKV